MDTIEQYREQLNQIMDQIYQKQEEDVSEIALLKEGTEALECIENVLAADPFDIDNRVLLMQLHNDWIFSDISKVIEQAEFIIQNDAFGESKNVGYDWLIWVYLEKLALPDKAVALLEEQIMLAYSLEKLPYKKAEKLGFLLDKMGSIYQNSYNDMDKAIGFYLKSFEEFPNMHHRNGHLSFLLLEAKRFDEAIPFLLLHSYWALNYDDDWELKYTPIIQKLYQNNELENHPDIIALGFHSIRNNFTHFGLAKKKDFYKKYEKELLVLTEKYPNCSVMNLVTANMYYFDIQNYTKALDFYKKMLLGDKPIYNSVFDRINNCCNKLDLDVFELPFSLDGEPNQMYNYLTICKELYSETEDIRYAKLAEKYGEKCYEMYYDYFYNHNGKNEHNQDFIFAMACNNYGRVLLDVNKDEDPQKLKEIRHKAAQIHWIGYQMDPDYSNLNCCRNNAIHGEDQEMLVRAAKEIIEKYADEIEVIEVFRATRNLVVANSKLNDFPETEKYYNQIKTLFIETEDVDKELATQFLFSAAAYTDFAVNKLNQFERLIDELEWLCNISIFEKTDTEELGWMNYILATAYKNLNKVEKAVQFYDKTIYYLENSDNFWYKKFSNFSKVMKNEMMGLVSKINIFHNFCNQQNHHNIQLSLEKKYHSEQVNILVEIAETLLDDENNYHRQDENTIILEFFYWDENNSFQIRYYDRITDEAYYFKLFRFKKSAGLFSFSKITHYEFFAEYWVWTKNEKYENYIDLTQNFPPKTSIQETANTYWLDLINRFDSLKKSLKK